MDNADRQWMVRAACRAKPVEMFVEHPDPVPAEVIRVCYGCEVKVECLAWALTGEPVDWGTGNPLDAYGPRYVQGIWGGTTLRERKKLLRFIPRVKCPLCDGGDLRALPGSQVCLGCGQSWPTVRPGARSGAQARLNAEAA